MQLEYQKLLFLLFQENKIRFKSPRTKSYFHKHELRNKLFQAVKNTGRNSFFDTLTSPHIAQKMKFSSKDCFSKFENVKSWNRKLHFWSHLLNKFLMEKLILCVVTATNCKRTDTSITNYNDYRRILWQLMENISPYKRKNKNLSLVEKQIKNLKYDKS